MQSRMIAVSLGIAIVAFLPALPSLGLLAVLMLFLALMLLRIHQQSYRAHVTWLLLFLIAVSYASNYGQRVLESRLPVSMEDVPVLVTGYVTGLPQTKQSYQQLVTQFEFQLIDGPIAVRKILLHWQTDRAVLPGEIWQLRVSLRRPRGLANHEGFDYQKWLVEQGVDAKGLVLASAKNRRIDNVPISIDLYRYQFSLFFDQELSNIRHLALIKALLIADKRAVTKQQWRFFVETGTIHLFAISGLHIGIVAGLGFFCGRVIALCFGIQAYRLSAVTAIIFAFLYAAAAGFSVPTQRALIMLVVFMLSMLSGRYIPIFSRFLLALTACLLIHPLSIISMSFWYSFVAVAGILVCCCGRYGRRQVWSSFLLAQYAVFIVLMPVSFLVLQQWVWNSFFANLIVVPVFSLVFLPFLFVAFLFSLLGVEFLWYMVEAGFDVLLWWLALIHQHTEVLYIPDISWYWLVLLFVFVAMLLIHPAKWLFCLLPLILIFNEKPKSEGLHVHSFDVGQGLAALVVVHDKVLLFDTGASWADDSFANTIILPYLRSRGIKSIDTLVISHGDNDHAGGIEDLLASMDVNRVFVGEQLPGRQFTGCAEQSWQWQGATLSLLRADITAFESANNMSCTLKIDYAGRSLLLTGDIERSAELALVNCCAQLLGSDILFAPHHGSISSSSWPFIKRVEPKWVVYSAGYKNRFRHPHQVIVKRYSAMGAQALSTANDGAIDIRVGKSGQIAIDAARWHKSFYWQ